MGRLLRWAGWSILCAALLGAAALAAFRLEATRREARDARDAAPAGGRFVRAHDVELFVQEAGPAGGAPVLLMHGTGAWSETWRHTLSSLAAAGFRGAALDLPPFGFSSRPAGGAYDPPTQGRRIAAAVEALSPGRPVVLVAHSFGGGPAMEAVFLAPERFAALVLVDVALGLDAPDAPAPFPVRAVTALPPLRDAVVATFLTNPRFTRRLLQAFVADPAAATEERIAIYARPLAVNGTTPAVGQWLPVLFAPRSGLRSASSRAYAGLKLPTLVLWGRLDTITPPAQGEGIAAAIPGARLAWMERVGHIPQIEDAQAFDSLLLEFLRGLAKGASA